MKSTVNNICLVFCLIAVANVSADTSASCPVIEKSKDPSLIVSAEPICIKAQEKYASSTIAEASSVPKTSDLDPIIASLLRNNYAIDANDTLLQAYVTAIITLIALPLFCCITNGCCGGCHCFARIIAEVICPTFFCCAPCMCRPSTKKPYSKVEKLYPIGLFVLFSFAAVSTAIIGTAGGTGQFQDTFVRGSCLIDNTRVKVTAFIDQFKIPVVGFKSAFGEISDYVSKTVGSTASISLALDELTTAYADVAAAADQTVHSYQSTYPNEPDANQNGVADDHAVGCDGPLEAVYDATTAASKAASDSALELIKKLDDIGSSVNETLVGQKIFIEESIDGAAVLIDELRKNVDETMQAAASIMIEQATLLENDPSIMSNVSFSAFNWIYECIFLFVVGFIFIILNSHKHNIELKHVHSNPKLEGNILDVGHVGACGARCGALSWCLVFTFGAVASGLGAAFYPISKVYGDVCVVIDELPLKLGKFMGGASTTPTASPAASRRLNMLDSISQRSLDSFSEFLATHTNIQSNNRRNLDEAEGGMDVTNILTTCWADGSIYDAMNLVEKIPINSTEMFSGFSSVPDNGSLGDESKDSLDELIAKIEDMEYCPVAKSTLITKINIVKDKTDLVSAALKSYKTNMGQIKGKAVDVLEGQIDLIKCVKCGFIKGVWDDTYSVICTQAYSAIKIFAECMVAIGFLSFFVASFQLLILRRWGGHGPIKAHDHGDDGLQLVITQHLESMCGCLSHHRKKDDDSDQPKNYEMAVMDDQNTTNQYTSNADEEVAAQYEYNTQEVDGEVEGELI